MRSWGYAQLQLTFELECKGVSCYNIRYVEKTWSLIFWCEIYGMCMKVNWLCWLCWGVGTKEQAGSWAKLVFIQFIYMRNVSLQMYHIKRIYMWHHIFTLQLESIILLHFFSCKNIMKLRAVRIFFCQYQWKWKFECLYRLVVYV